ncbi:phosphoenolpyruvate carboxylase [Silvibacterium bohemicum]|uniref:Phosphoenolpyruvate carboxylase n=1 Tax=Silvibacterium bohemicum TaxID=1577686 RepID=A0A841K878_9BACT|nr:phosphoenolpyruvate carboxylase [Silvibacterium bohemicum]
MCGFNRFYQGLAVQASEPSAPPRLRDESFVNDCSRAHTVACFVASHPRLLFTKPVILTTIGRKNLSAFDLNILNINLLKKSSKFFLSSVVKVTAVYVSG